MSAWVTGPLTAALLALPSGWLACTPSPAQSTLPADSSRGGLDRFDVATRTFVHYRHDASNPASLADDWVSTVHEDRAGHLWIATLSGLDLLEPATGRFVHYRHDSADPQSLGDDDLLALCEDDASERGNYG